MSGADSHRMRYALRLLHTSMRAVTRSQLNMLQHVPGITPPPLVSSPNCPSDDAVRIRGTTQPALQHVAMQSRLGMVFCFGRHWPQKTNWNLVRPHNTCRTLTPQRRGGGRGFHGGSCEEPPGDEGLSPAAEFQPPASTHSLVCGEGSQGPRLGSEQSTKMNLGTFCVDPCFEMDSSFLGLQTLPCSFAMQL